MSLSPQSVETNWVSLSQLNIYEGRHSVKKKMRWNGQLTRELIKQILVFSVGIILPIWTLWEGFMWGSSASSSSLHTEGTNLSTLSWNFACLEAWCQSETRDRAGEYITHLFRLQCHGISNNAMQMRRVMIKECPNGVSDCNGTGPTQKHGAEKGYHLKGEKTRYRGPRGDASKIKTYTMWRRRFLGKYREMDRHEK